MKNSKGYIIRFYEGLVCIATKNVFGCKLAREEAHAYGFVKTVVKRGEQQDLLCYATYSKI